MACLSPFDAFRQHVESFVEDIYKLSAPQRVLYDLIPRTDYPHGEGLTRNVFTIARSLPTTDTPEFETVAISDETPGGACATAYNAVEVGYTEKTYVPEKFGWKGITICSDDLIFSHRIDSFLSAYLSQMAKNTAWTIENRYAAIYDHFVPKAVANTDFAFGDPGTGAPGQAPDLTLDESVCELTQEMLDTTAQELAYEGATMDPTSDGWITFGANGPVYTLQIGPEMSKRLFLNNSELREDVRHAYQRTETDSPLIQALYTSKQLGNFKHLINLFPPRYTYAAGEYTRVNTWITDATLTKGTGVKINPDWKNAPFEGIRVLSPHVFTSEIVRPTNSAAGLNWPVKSYMGDWSFVVGGNNIGTEFCADPLQKLGKHFAEFWHAPRPVKPLYGRLIIALRCPGTYTCTNCSSNEVT
jgi:hypothetical protein